MGLKMKYTYYGCVIERRTNKGDEHHGLMKSHYEMGIMWIYIIIIILHLANDIGNPGSCIWSDVIALFFLVGDDNDAS